MPNILDALRAMDESADKPPEKGSVSAASALVAALNEEALGITSTRGEDVTVATLRGCVKRLRDAEKKLERASSKNAIKSAALAEVTNSGAEAHHQQQGSTSAAKKRQMSAKKSAKGVKFFKGRDNAHQAASREAKALDLGPRSEFEARFSTHPLQPAAYANYDATMSSQFINHQRNSNKLFPRRRLSEGLH